MLTETDHIKEILLHTDTDKLDDILLLESRGIELTFTKMQLLFLNRGYGKSYMAFTAILLAILKSKPKAFSLSHEALSGVTEFVPIYKDPDLFHASKFGKASWIRELNKFVERYAPEYERINATDYVLRGEKDA